MKSAAGTRACRLGVSKDVADRLRSKHMRRVLEEHEYVLQSYRSQRFGGRTGR